MLMLIIILLLLLLFLSVFVLLKVYSSGKPKAFLDDEGKSIPNSISEKDFIEIQTS
jgi:hypothetical protein